MYCGGERVAILETSECMTCDGLHLPHPSIVCDKTASMISSHGIQLSKAYVHSSGVARAIGLVGPYRDFQVGFQ